MKYISAINSMTAVIKSASAYASGTIINLLLTSLTHSPLPQPAGTGRGGVNRGQKPSWRAPRPLTPCLPFRGVVNYLFTAASAAVMEKMMIRTDSIPPPFPTRITVKKKNSDGVGFKKNSDHPR